MKKTIRTLVSSLLVLAMLVSILPTGVLALGPRPVVNFTDKGEVITAEAHNIVQEDIWNVIDAFEAENITNAATATVADYAALSKQVEKLVKASDTFVKGSIVRNGDFFTWETTEGIVCGYNPLLRQKSAKAGSGNAVMSTGPVEEIQAGNTPDSASVYLISPYYNSSYSADSSFTDQYLNEVKSVASATGGSAYQYGYTSATIDNIATAMESGAVVMFDSHGTTDYASGDDYVSQANTSYLCLKTGTGITSADMTAVSGTYGTYYHAYNGGSAYCVDGTAISNHMDQDAPNSLLWMAICLGMATKGLNAPLRNRGVHTVYGYSQSVSFTGDYKYEAGFWDKMIAGNTVASAISYIKSTYGYWDPAYSSYSYSSARSNYVAFPIVASVQDTYPGQGNVDTYQTVNSQWTLFQETTSCSHSSTSTSTTPATCTTAGKTVVTCNSCGATVSTTTIPATGHSYSNGTCTVCGASDGSSSGSTTTDSEVFELVTSASDLTAGRYIVMMTATSSVDYPYYVMMRQEDSAYWGIDTTGVSFDSLPTGLTCTNETLIWNVTGSSSALKFGNGGSEYLYVPSGYNSRLCYGESTATSFTASYNSSKQAFTLKATYYVSFRDDYSYSTATGNGNPVVMGASSTSTGTCYFHLYKSNGGSSDSGTTECSHSNTSTSTTAATCTASGKTVVTCDDCGETISTTTIPATGHVSTSTSTTPATCTTAGKTVVTCNSCGVTVSSTTIPATGHSYSNGYCTVCGASDGSSSGGSDDSGSSSSEEVFTLVTSASEITDGRYIILAAATNEVDYSHYALMKQEDGAYWGVDSLGANFDSVPSSLTATDSVIWTLSGSSSSFTLSDGGSNVLYNPSGYSNRLCYGESTATSWKASYNSSKQAFTLKATYYMSLRDDMDYSSTASTNGNPIFYCVSSTSTGSCYFYLYKSNAGTSDSGDEDTGSDSGSTETSSFAGRYYIAAKRSSGNYMYMTNTTTGWLTKRYSQEDSGLTTLPTSIASPDANKVFVLVDNGDGTYKVYAEGISGTSKYLGWSSGNSGKFVTEANALNLSVEKNSDGTFYLYFTSGSTTRYLSLNSSASYKYFAFYTGTQVDELSLIPCTGASKAPVKGGFMTEIPG